MNTAQKKSPSFLTFTSSILAGVGTVLYPVAIWWCLTHYSPRVTGLVAVSILVPLLGGRLWRRGRQHFWHVLRVPLSIIVMMLIGVVSDDERVLLMIPVLINAALLVSFGATLFEAMTMVERFARLQEPGLSAAKIAHCRQVTVAWCIFFFVNGALAALLAWRAPVFWWAAYTGGIAYGLMGLIFVVEYVVRKARFRDYGTGLHDRLLALVFPPDASEEVS